MNDLQANGRQFFYEITQSQNIDDIRRLKAAIQGANRDKVDILTDNFVKVLLKDSNDSRKESIKAWIEYKINKGGKEELKKVFDKTVSNEFKSADKKAESTKEKDYLKSPQYQIDELNKSLSGVSVQLKNNKTLARDCLEAILTTNILGSDLDIVIKFLYKLEMNLSITNDVLKSLLIIKTLVTENKLTDEAVDLFMQIDIDNLIHVFESLKNSSENEDAYIQLGNILNNYDTNSSIQIALPKNDKKTTVRSLFKEIREQRELQRDLIQALKELKVTIQEDVKSQTLIKWEKEISDEVKKISLSLQSISSQVAKSKPVIRPKAPKTKNSIWNRILAPFKWIAKPFIWFINLFRKNKI